MFHIDFVFPHHMCVFPTTSCFREVRQNLIWALRAHFPFCLWWFLGREVMKTICPYKRVPPALSLASHWPRMTQLFLGLLWLRYQHLEEQCRSRPGDLWQRDQCNAYWIGRWKSPNQLTFHMAVSTAVNMHCKETNYLTDWLTTWFSMKMVNEKLAGTLKLLMFDAAYPRKPNLHIEFRFWKPKYEKYLVQNISQWPLLILLFTKCYLTQNAHRHHHHHHHHISLKKPFSVWY
jgi:hypothetical protein